MRIRVRQLKRIIREFATVVGPHPTKPLRWPQGGLEEADLPDWVRDIEHDVYRELTFMNKEGSWSIDSTWMYQRDIVDELYGRLMRLGYSEKQADLVLGQP